MCRLGFVRWTVLVAAAWLTLGGLAGCGQGSGAQAGGQGAPDSNGDDLMGRTFVSESVTQGGQPHELVSGTRITLSFPEDGRIVANSGCNTISGQARLDRGKIETGGDLATTEMGCPAGLHEQDDWLIRLLQSLPTWQLDGDQLVIAGNEAELTMIDRSVADPALPIEGTKWQVESIRDGEVVSSMPAGSSAHLTFNGGRVSGSTSCNSLEGPATITGTAIEFGQLALTRKACPPELQPVEEAVVAALQGTVPYQIESSQLRLNPGGGQGLDLRG